MRRAVRLLILVLSVGAVAGCSYLPWQATPAPTPMPLGVRVVTPPEQLRLEVSNGTTIPVAVTVNGAPGRPIPAGRRADLGIADIGPLPWAAQVRTGSGRVLVQLTVRPGDVWTQENADGSSESQGDGARVDLSCGRIDIWSGTPMMGPAPGPGVPGDCDP
jgi:hypothetical protein